MLDPDTLSERRIHPRASVKLPIKYRVFDDEPDLTTVPERQKKTHTSYTQNVSLGGLYLVTDQDLNLETFLRLDISLPDYHQDISAFADVVWSNNKGAGLHFAAIKDEDVETLKNYLSLVPC